MNAILISDKPSRIERVYTAEQIERLSALCGLERRIYTKEEILREWESFSQVRFLFSTWGMPVFEKDEILRIFPQLEAVFYAAGSVQRFAAPFLELGIRMFSAWAANGIPVAEYTFAQITLAMKGFFGTSLMLRREGYAKARAYRTAFPGNYDATVGIIGAGMIGKMVIEKLKALSVNVLVFDPFLPEEKARELGVEKTDLATLFSSCQVVSNHLANNEKTKGMLKGEHFSSMLHAATFLNTGRGAQVVEEELIEVLKERPDLTAILDVTFPEPPEESSPLYSMDNVILTPHIAGSEGNEVHRMAEFMIREAEAVTENRETRYEVSLAMLETMA